MALTGGESCGGERIYLTAGSPSLPHTPAHQAETTAMTDEEMRTEIGGIVDRLPGDALRVILDTARYFLRREVDEDLIPPPPAPEVWEFGDPHDTL